MLLREGWTLRVDPGAPVSLHRGEEAVEPFGVAAALDLAKAAG